MKSQDEIVARIESRKADDFFGFEVSEYVDFLDYQHAKPYLKPEVTENEWKQTDKTPKEVMIDYMPFAWEKANNCRGLSAGRSLKHYVAWLWLDGDNELWPTIEDYEYYGKNQLVEICNYLELNSSQWDDGIRVNSE